MPKGMQSLNLDDLEKVSGGLENGPTFDDLSQQSVYRQDVVEIYSSNLANHQ